MKNRLLLTLVIVLVSMLFSSSAFAAKKGNARKGKYLFRKNCRSCHIENGAASALSPISKTQAQWVAVFENDGFKKLECKGEWEKRKAKDLKDVFAYMHNHAYDSPSPQKCK